MNSINAMAEVLHQLFEAGQYRSAERFIDHSDRGLLERLATSGNGLVTLRIDYVIRKSLKRRSTYGAFTGLVENLPYVLNVWCREGRRAAIRLVLAELDPDDLDALGKNTELDPEVFSMLRLFRNDD